MVIKTVKLYKSLTILTSCLFIVLCSFLVGITGAQTVYLGGTIRKLPIYSVDRNDNKIAISFDCAYGADKTLNLLNTLDEYGVKCTFFCVEFWVNKFPDMVKEIVDRGHEIGTHSKTHPKMSTLKVSEIESELTSSINAIENITGQKVELFRAPFGDYDNDVITVAENLDLYTIQWDVDSLDWKDVTVNQIVNRIVNKTVSGSIILCHNNGENTDKALPYVLARLKEKGFEFVKISELIYKQNYQINPFGKQVKTEK
ncbi:MAG: polysaccharide deacetylase family protein [Clostridia bacterium]|nr:polysaccharide deacetylase family protein [Clostridia bacterium]